MTAVAILTVFVAGCGGGRPGASAEAHFCGTFRNLNAHPGSIFNGLGPAPAGLDSGTETKTLLPAFRRISGVFGQLDKEAPTAVKPDMNTLTPLFDYYVSALSRSSTYGQTQAYERTHPPRLDPARAVSAERHLGGYLRATCHVTGIS